MSEDNNGRKKYQVDIPANMPIDIGKVEKDIHDAAYNVTFTCDDCRRMQEENYKQEDVKESNISKKHMVKRDCGVLAWYASIYGAEDLEEDAQKFALEFCGTGNKELCDKGREFFVKNLYETIKAGLKQGREKRKESGSGSMTG